jgi:catechol 2,3-dioxygenase-like lactoylglutathione lyase family enzyme
MSSATKTEANVKQAAPFFWVHDIDASLRFYVDGLGFTVTTRWVDDGKLRWCWLELGEAAIMLQEFWRSGQHTNMPEGRVGRGVSIYFICEDAVSLWRELVARGVAAKRPFVGNRMWVMQVADPDGYDLLFESPTDAPDESVLPDDQ